jgi:hypothetical protein
VELVSLLVLLELVEQVESVKPVPPVLVEPVPLVKLLVPEQAAVEPVVIAVV